MPVVRLSLVEPIPGREKEVESLLDELGEFHAQLPGHIIAAKFQPVERPHMRGRISIWRSEEDINHAASLSHTIALRSRLKYAADIDDEQLFEVIGKLHGLQELVKVAVAA